MTPELVETSELVLGVALIVLIVWLIRAFMDAATDFFDDWGE